MNPNKMRFGSKKAQRRAEFIERDLRRQRQQWNPIAEAFKKDLLKAMRVLTHGGKP